MPGQKPPTSVGLGAFLDEVASASPSVALAFQSRDPLAYFPELAGDFALDPALQLFAAAKHLQHTMWISPAATHSVLHCDLVDNLNTQIEGRKEFVLFSPRDTRHLAPTRMFYSPLDPDRAAHRARSDFARARPMVAVLEPGDALYIPFCWWHWVRAERGSLNISSIAILRGAGQQWRKWRVTRGHPLPVRVVASAAGWSHTTRSRLAGAFWRLARRPGRRRPAAGEGTR